jgi:myo-inositol-1(or 4)-monophosphatase
MNTEIIENFYQVAQQAVLQAGKTILDFQQQFLEIQFKDDYSPVTKADQTVERQMIAFLHSHFPDHQILGEESLSSRQEYISGYTWIIDPIDGTWSFLNHELTSCVTLGLAKEGKALISIVYNPFTNELYSAVEGKTSTLNQKLLPLTNWPTLKKGVLNYQISKNHTDQIQSILKIWQERKIGKLISQGGSINQGTLNQGKSR